MPIFGKSLFETVLDGLDSPSEEEDDAVHRSPRRLGPAFVAGFSTRDDDGAADPYSGYEDFGPATAEMLSAIPVWAERISDGEIAADLDLDPHVNESQLREKRRAFARLNHPDLVHPDYRATATRRMMVANQLIDAAMARLARQA